MEHQIDPLRAINHCIARLELIDYMPLDTPSDISVICHDVRLTLHELATMFQYQTFQPTQESYDD